MAKANPEVDPLGVQASGMESGAYDVPPPNLEADAPDVDWAAPSEIEGVPPGDYRIEVMERTDPTKWWGTKMEEAKGPQGEDIPKSKSLNFQLEIVGPSEVGRVIFPNFMYWISPKAQKEIEEKSGYPFNPRNFLDPFLAALGVASVVTRAATRTYTILPEFLDEDKRLDPIRFAGLQCMIKYGPDKKTGEFMNVLKAWKVTT